MLFTEMLHLYILPHDYQQQGRAQCISVAGQLMNPAE